MQPPASNIQSNFKVPSSRQTITTNSSNLAKPTVNVPGKYDYIMICVALYHGPTEKHSLPDNFLLDL